MSGFARSAPTFDDAQAPSNYKAGMGRGGKGGMGFSTRGDIGPSSSSSIGAGTRSTAASSGTFVDSRFGSAPKGYVAGRGRGMGALAKEQSEGITMGGGESTNDADFDKFSGYSGKSMFANDPYDQDDDEADRIWDAVDKTMASRGKRKREVDDNKQQHELEKVKQKSSNARDGKLSDQFVDLKRNLGTLTAAEWDSIPEVGDSSLKYTQQRRFENVYVPLPDNIINSAAERLTGGSNFAKSAMIVDDETTGEDVGLSKMRSGGLVGKLDNMSNRIGGQTVVDPQGYMTSLDSMNASTVAEVSDVKKARVLLGSVTATNPHHAPGWIAAARVEEVAGKMSAAKKIACEGCEMCPQSEDLWLESARLNGTADAKVILATAIKHNPSSVKLWLKAADMEDTVRNKRSILRKALEIVPSSVKLWKAAIELENADDARIMLGRAVECVPDSTEMWLALAKLETYDNARKVLNQAREALPNERQVWITAAKLEEAHGNTKIIDKIVSKMVTSLTEVQEVAIDRNDWLQEAKNAEESGSKQVCASIVHHTLDLGVEEEDRLVTWADDAEACLLSNNTETSRAIYNHALLVLPTEQTLWLGLAALEKDHSSGSGSGPLQEVLQRAVQHCPHVDVFWLMAAKGKWLDGFVDEARSLLDEALRSNPTSESIWQAAGKLEWENDNPKRARAVFEKARKTLPSSPRLWMKAALLERELGEIGKAMTLLEEGKKMFPKFWKFYAMAAEYATTEAAARDSLKSGISMCPESFQLSILLAHLEEKAEGGGVNKARSVLELGRLHAASSAPLLLEAIRLERRHNLDKLADALIAKGKQECSPAGLIWAEDLLTCGKPAFKTKSIDALKSCDNDAHVILAVARIFIRDKKIDKARKWLQRACQLNPKLGDAWAHYYAFEVQQEARKKSGAAMDTDGSTVLEEIEAACAKAEPNLGELWNSTRKQLPNRRLPYDKVLKVAVQAILVSGSISNSK